MKRKYLILSAVVLSLIATAVLVYRNASFSGALNRAGLRSRDVTVHVRGFDDNGEEYRIVQVLTKDSSVALAHMVKHKWGWRCYPSVLPPDRNLILIGWVNAAGIRRYAFGENLIFGAELHHLYYGDNAIKLIELKPDDIPGNVTVNIRQEANEYWIHVFSFAEPDVFNSFDLHAVLVETGCVED